MLKPHLCDEIEQGQTVIDTSPGRFYTQDPLEAVNFRGVRQAPEPAPARWRLGLRCVPASAHDSLSGSGRVTYVPVTPTRARVLFSCLPVLTLGLAGPVSGQTSTLQQRLAQATSLDCAFSTMATGSWDNGTPAGKLAPSTLKVKFTGISADDGTAYAEASLGKSSIVVRYSNDYLHLMQIHSAGPLYTTTVLAQQTKDGRLMAVHTRHEYTAVSLPGFTSRPEMYFGDCAVTP